MINITKRISFSKNIKRSIKAFKKINGPFNKKSWININSNVKNSISKRLLFNHLPKCVYCERYLISVGNQIDHFANKSDFPQYSFSSTNLFNSCTYCNSSSRKGSKPTIINNSLNRYNLCKFLIIHPYFDNPDIEIIYKDSDRIYFDWESCTQKGKDTIKFLGLDDFVMTNLRAKYLVMERLNPLSTPDEKKLIQEIISYKK